VKTQGYEFGLFICSILLATQALISKLCQQQSYFKEDNEPTCPLRFLYENQSLFTASLRPGERLQRVHSMRAVANACEKNIATFRDGTRSCSFRKFLWVQYPENPNRKDFRAYYCLTITPLIGYEGTMLGGMEGMIL